MSLFGPPNIEKLKVKGDIKGLIKLLAADNFDVRDEAIKALVQIGGARVIKELIAALTNDKKRRAAAQALAKIGPDAVEPLITSLKNSWKPEVRCCAADILGEIGDCRAVEPLVAILNTNDGLEAAMALAKLGDVRAVKPLIDTVAPPPQYSAYAEKERTRLAFEALVKMGNPAVNPLIAALFMNQSKWSDLSLEAVLVEIGEPAVEPLIAALEVRRAWVLVEILAKIGDKRARGGIIDYIFLRMDFFPDKHFRKLFGGYSQLIDDLINGVIVREVTVEISSWEETRYSQDDPPSENWQSWHAPRANRRKTTYEYSFTERLGALEKLISIDTPVSSNLLHKVKNFPIGSKAGCQESIEQMRRNAAEELIRRGNPPYELSAYLRIE